MSQLPPTYSDTTYPYPPVDTPNVQPSNPTADPEVPGAYPPVYTNQNVTPLPLTQQPYPPTQELAPTSKPTTSNQQDRFNRNRGQRNTYATNPKYFKIIVIFAAISMLFSFPIGACATCVAVYAQSQFRSKDYNSAKVLSWIATALGIASIILGIAATVIFVLMYSRSRSLRVLFSS